MRLGDLKIGEEIQYKNAVYKIVRTDDNEVCLEFVRNKYNSPPSIYDIEYLVRKVLDNAVESN